MGTAYIPDNVEFDRVESEINRVIAEIKPDCLDMAVNWGDISCSELYWRIDRNGEAHWVAVVSEASPDEWGFASAISDKLAAKGIRAHVNLVW